MAYEILAKYYDELMTDVDYKAWFKGLCQICLRHGKRIDETLRILELACGTGRMTVQFAKTGARVVATDLSPEMLTIAEYRLRQAGCQVLLLQQDMRECFLPYPVDVVFCLCDSLNYLTDAADITRVFARVARYLKAGGLFIFDLNTRFKLSQIYGNNTYAEKRDSFSYIWENIWDPSEEVCQMDLTFYVKRPDGLFVEYNETHRETFFDSKVVEKALAEAGMKLLESYGDDLATQPGEFTERITYVAARG